MRYLLLIYNTEPTEAVPADLMASEQGAYNAFTAAIRETGQFEAGEALQPTSTATTVRVENGRTITTDGPFAETKEAARRVLPRRRPGHRRGDRARRADPRRHPRLDRDPAHLGPAERVVRRGRCRRRLRPTPSSTACSGRNRAGRSRR